MARLVKSFWDYKLAFTLQTVFNDDSYSNVVMNIGDMVNDIRYIEDGEVKTVSGVLRNISYKINTTAAKRKYTALDGLKSYFAEDVVPTSITIDASTEYHSNLYEIPCMELIEFASESNVKRMKFFLTFGLTFESYLTDLSHYEFELFEGSYVNNLTFMNNGTDGIIDTKVVAITYDIKTLKPSALICVADNKVRNIPLTTIINAGETSDSVDISQINFDEALSDGGKLVLSAGTTNATIPINGDTILVGANAGVSGIRRVTGKSYSESILSGKIQVNAGANVTIDGFTLTEDAALTFANCENVTIHNV